MVSMGAEFAATATGWQTWRFGCDVCDRRMWTALDREAKAMAMAKANGWIVGAATLCPACAVVATHHQAEFEQGEQGVAG